MGPDVERALLERVRCGDADAFEELYLEHVGLVHGYVARHYSRSDADDVTAETFVRAWEMRERFEWRGIRYRAWLLRIARNLALGRMRVDARLQRFDTGTLDVAAAPLPQPDAVVAHRWEVAALRRLVDALPALQREVIVLRFVEGLPAIEVAVVLDRAHEAVRSAQYRALQTLRRELEALDVFP